MYCKHCKITVKNNINICPLCHEILTNDNEEFVETLPLRIKPTVNPSAVFSRIFIFTALNIIILFSVINAIWIHQYLWTILVTLLLMYTYVLVKNTILSNKNVARKIFTQTLFISAICIIIQYWIIKTPYEWCFTYAIPLVSLLSAIMLGIFTFINIQDAREFLLYFLGIAFFGFTPIIINNFINIKVIWPAVVSALASVTIVLSLLCFASKELIKEIIKKFHA